MRQTLAKAMIFFLSLLVILPILMIFLWSFTARWPWPDLLPKQFTLRAWEDLYRQREKIIKVMMDSVLISVIVGFLSVIISSLAARGLFLLSAKSRKWITFFLSLPMLIPATIFGMGIQVEFIKWGLNNTMLGVILVHLVYSLPYANFLLIDAFDNLGFELQEQGQVLGANRFQTIVNITLPLLFPILLNAFIMAYVVSFSQYFLTLLIGGGRIQTFSLLMFPHLLNNDRTIASSYGILFLIFTMLIFFIFRSLSRAYIVQTNKLSQGVSDVSLN